MAGTPLLQRLRTETAHPILVGARVPRTRHLPHHNFDPEHPHLCLKFEETRTCGLRGGAFQQLFEFHPFNLPFRGNYPKYILTRSDPIQQRNGIIHRNLPEFIRAGSTF